MSSNYVSDGDVSTMLTRLQELKYDERFVAFPEILLKYEKEDGEVDNAEIIATLAHIQETGVIHLTPAVNDNTNLTVRYCPNWFLVREIQARANETKHGNVIFNVRLVDTNSEYYCCSPEKGLYAHSIHYYAGLSDPGIWGNLSDDELEEVYDEVYDFIPVPDEPYFMSEKDMKCLIHRKGAVFSKEDIAAAKEDGAWFELDLLNEWLGDNIESYFEPSPGDKVFWHDPDNGVCSKKATFLKEEDGVVLLEADGVEFEALIGEIRNIMPLPSEI